MSDAERADLMRRAAGIEARAWRFQQQGLPRFAAETTALARRLRARAGMHPPLRLPRLRRGAARRMMATIRNDPRRRA